MLRLTIAIAIGTLLGLSAHGTSNAQSPTWEGEALDAVAFHSSQNDSQQSDEWSDGDGDDEAAIALQRNANRLAVLRKPLSEVRLQAVSRAVTPDNKAAQWLGAKTTQTITSSGIAVPGPERYSSHQWHRPLYFEELNLERCGKTYGYATNVVSGVHFLTNTAMLPYRLATQRPDCPISSRGDCQSCESYSHDIEPFGTKVRGGLAEAAAAAGFIFLLL